MNDLHQFRRQERNIDPSSLPGPGTQVRILHWSTVNEDGSPTVIDDNKMIPPGTLGIVDSIDDAGTIHVKWDGGFRLGILPSDEFEVVVEEDLPDA